MYFIDATCFDLVAGHPQAKIHAFYIPFLCLTHKCI
jgi:hypothetical protein